MESKKPGRRGFLKDAALAGLAVGAAKSASGEPILAEYSKKDLIAYGERSRFVTSARAPVPGRMSPDAFGLVAYR